MNKKKKKQKSSYIKPAPRRVDVSQFERDERKKQTKSFAGGKMRGKKDYQNYRLLSSVMAVLELEVWGEQVKKMQQQQQLKMKMV